MYKSDEVSVWLATLCVSDNAPSSGLLPNCVLFLSIIIARLQLRFDQVAALDEGKRREVYDTDILPAGRPGGALMAPLTLRFDSILDNYNERCA